MGDDIPIVQDIIDFVEDTADSLTGNSAREQAERDAKRAQEEADRIAKERAEQREKERKEWEAEQERRDKEHREYLERLRIANEERERAWREHMAALQQAHQERMQKLEAARDYAGMEAEKRRMEEERAEMQRKYALWKQQSEAAGELAKTGRMSTILTQAFGLEGQAPVEKKRLLGE